ncbi:MAG: thioredoxin domain-containing protein [Sphingobacteriia bacterium]|nr:thioredoxin domain-containing protein [Sphingobacteriia bacterium]
MIFNVLNNLTNTVACFLKQLDVKHTVFGVNEALHNHPDYPSLLSISDVLKKNYKMEVAALSVTNEKLVDIPLPFITLLKETGKPFITVTAIQNGVVHYADIKGNKVTKSTNAFLKLWNNTALIAEKTQRSAEDNFTKNRWKERVDKFKTPALLLIGLLAVVGVLIKNTRLPVNVLWWLAITGILMLTGLLISCLLVWYEIDKHNPVLKNICTGFAKTNCDAVLSSKASKVLGKLSWSEMGFFYFGGSLLYFLITAYTDVQFSYPLLFWLNISALPYTVFSVYYQWRVAKQWCVLCLTVQVVLIISFGTNQFIAGNYFPITFFSWQPASQVVLAFVLPVIGWYLLKPVLIRLQEAKSKSRQLMRLKYDTRIFEALLHKQKQITISATGLGITIGNPNATHILIKVCNPYCGPCANAHPDIEKIIQDNTNIKAQIIFTATANEDDKRSKPVKHLMAIAAKENAAVIAKALDDWYLADKKDYDVFAAKYPMNGELKQQDEKLKAMEVWCKQTDIAFTPTFFINGYQLPDMYNIRDLAYFLSE